MILAALLATSAIRCAHSPQTREQRECEETANRCLRDCQEPARREPDPSTATGPATDGCSGDTRTDCERRCQEPCEWGGMR